MKMIADLLARLPASGRPSPRQEDLIARRIAVAFVLYGLLATLLLAINMPPFQNPDEPAHLLRAAQLADGILVGSRVMVTEPDGRQYVQGGGLSDPALLTAVLPFSPMAGHPDIKATRQAWAPPVRWSDERTMAVFPNTAVYPPFFYIPSAVGVLAGRIAQETVVDSLIASRILTGVATVVVGAVAISLAGGAAIWIFAIMTLPMSLALAASTAPDAPIVAFSALAVALTIRMQRRPGLPNTGALRWLTLALGLVSMARPPYGSLILLLFALDQVSWRRCIIAATVVVICTVAWSAITSVTTLSNPGAFFHADPAQQIRFLLADPLRIVPLAGATLARHWRDYIVSFIGQLGWLDAGLPPTYYRAAMAMLVVAAVASALGIRGERVGAVGRLLVAGAILTGAAGVFAIQYLTWTLPGSGIIDGIQGRYFLPLALPVVALFPALGDTRLARLHQALVLVVVAFPIVTLGVVMHTIVVRYYLS
jgi:uncharacterized membrane protein